MMHAGPLQGMFIVIPSLKATSARVLAKPPILAMMHQPLLCHTQRLIRCKYLLNSRWLPIDTSGNSLIA